MTMIVSIKPQQWAMLGAKKIGACGLVWTESNRFTWSRFAAIIRADKFKRYDSGMWLFAGRRKLRECIKCVEYF